MQSMLFYHLMTLGLLTLLPLARGIDYAIHGAVGGVMSQAGGLAKHFPIAHKKYVGDSSHSDSVSSFSDFNVDHSSSDFYP